jgi:hypothetical protein
VPTIKLREDLLELANGRYFYCNESVGSSDSRRPEIDHFIPLSRFPNNNIENLVIAHAQCNRHKRNFIVCNAHLDLWVQLLNGRSADMEEIAASQAWPSDLSKSGGIASALFGGLPAGFYACVGAEDFELLDLEKARKSIAGIQV